MLLRRAAQARGVRALHFGGAAPRDSPPGGVPSARQLTARLSRANSVADALDVMRRYSATADDILLAAMWTKLRTLSERWSAPRRAQLLDEHASVVDTLAERTLARMRQLTPRALATITFSAARLSRPLCSRLLEPMAPVVAEQLPHFPPQSFAGVLWAYAQPLQPAREAADAEAMPLRRVAPPRTGLGEPGGGAATGAEADGASTRAAGGTEASGAETAQDRATYALSVFEAASEALLRANGDGSGAGQTGRPSAYLRPGTSQPAQPLSAWPSRDLADVAWAFAAASSAAGAPVACLEPVGQQAAQRLRMRGLSAREAATLAWAFARARAPHEPLRLALAEHVPALLGDCRSEELAMLAWAIAAWPSAGAAARAHGRAQQAASSLRDPAGCSALPPPSRSERASPAAADVREALGAEVARRCAARSLSPRQLAMCLWSVAALRTHGSLPFEAGARAAAECAHRLTPRQVSNVAWALARGPAGCAHPFLSALERGLGSAELRQFSMRELSTVAWAVCVSAGLAITPQLMRRIVHIANGAPLEAFSEADRSALLQAGLSLRLDAPQLRLRLRADLAPGALASAYEGSPALGGPAQRAVHGRDGSEAQCAQPGLRESASAVDGSRSPAEGRSGPAPAAVPMRAHARAPQPQRMPPSRLHAHVSAALQALGIAHVNDFVVPGLGYTVDVALSDARIAIEIAGPQHHAHAPPLRATRTAMAASACEASPPPAAEQWLAALPGADAADATRDGPRLQRAALLKWRHLERAGWQVLVLPFQHLHTLLPSASLRRPPASRRDGAKLDAAAELTPMARYLRTRLSASLAALDSAEDDDEGAWAIGALDADRPLVSRTQMQQV